MEPNESNLKPQPTGGLKLMTVFIAVIALHVLVIGGFTIWWHLLNSSTGDDLALDKAHKGAKIADTTQSGDISPGDVTDKSATSTPAITDNTVVVPPATGDTPTTPGTASALAPKPAPAPLNVTPPPVSDDASSVASNPTPQTPSGPTQHGPVVNPPDSLAAPEPSEATATTTPADSTTPVADGTPYTVKKGDSLARIARRHHVALAQLKTANSLANDKLSIGQKLVIPNRATKAVASDASAPAGTPVMTSADTSASTTANASDTESATPAPASSTSSLASATTKPTHTHKATAGHHLYTVVKGDTLTRIARKFRTTANAIMAANNITNASRLSIGKKLRIPSGDSRNAAADSVPTPTPAEPETKPAAHGQLANYVQ